jgi:hypothetical protein
MAQFKEIKFKETVAKQVGTDEVTGRPLYNFIEEDKSLSLREFMKAELTNTKFWLMLKLKDPERWERKWNRYINDLYKFIVNQMEGNDKGIAAKGTLERIERSAWRTLPTPFLKDIGIPRPIRK